MSHRVSLRRVSSRTGTGAIKPLVVAVTMLVVLAASTAFAVPSFPAMAGPDASQELASMRTATAKHFYVGRGRYLARISSQAIHYLDSAGRWQDIDTTIATVDGGDYSYAAQRNGLRTYFKQSGEAHAAVRAEIGPRSLEDVYAGRDSLGWLTWQPTLLSYETEDGHSLTISHAKPTEAKVRENVLVYDGGFLGVAERYTVRNNLLKHDLVVSDLPALSSRGEQPAFLSYEGLIQFPEGFSLYADGEEQTGSFTTQGSIELRDGAGHTALSLRAAYAYEEANRDTSVRARYVVEVSGRSARLAVQVPYAWLADAARVYPVVIDPTVSIDTTRDTDIDEDNPNTNYGGESTLTVCNKSELVCNERALLYFDLSNIPAGYDTEATIQDADMYLWVDYLWALGDYWYIEVDTHALTTDWTEYGATWNSPWTTPGGDYDGYRTTTTIWGDEEGEVKSWIMTYIVRWWYGGELPNYGVILRSDHEDGGTKYARFNSRDAGSYAPYLEVTYTLTPCLLTGYAEQVHGTPDPSQHFQFTYTNNYWQAVGINPPGGTDYDLRLYSDSDYSTERAYSDGANDVVDFVVVNGDALGAPSTYYPLAEAYSGTGDYPIEWAEGAFPELSDGSLGPFTMGSDDVVRVLDTELSNGSTYYFSVFPTSGDADLGIALFSPSNGNYQDRFDAVAGADSYFGGQPEFFQHTASTSGYHGLVVWNEGATSNTNFTVYRDTDPPSCSIAINNGDAYATNSSVTLNLSASDAQTGVWQMRFQDFGGSWSSWTDYASTYPWTLPEGDGQKTVYAEFKNYAGMVSQCSDSITLDRGDPQSQASVSQEYWNTSSSPVPVNWTASDSWSGVGSVKLSVRKEGGSWADSGLAPQSGTSGTFSYWPTSEGRYYFQTSATDGAGNQEDPPSGSSGNGDDSVFYDATKPSSSLVYCPGYANSTFSVEYNASDGSGSGLQTLELQYKKESGGTWSYYGTCSPVASGWCDFTPPSGEGTYYLGTRAQDFAGLWEDAPNGSGDCSTFYETQNPNSTITRPSGPGWYNLTVVYRMEGTASDTGGSGLDEIELSIKRDSDNYYWHGCGGGWQSGGESWFAANGTTGWYYEPACTPWENTKSYTLRSLAKDNAGNLESSPAQVQFSYDNVKPYSSVGVPGDGDNRNTLTDVSGTANDNGGSSLYKVYTSIKRNSDNYYWNGSGWTSGSEVWLEAWRSGSTWVYDTDFVTWQSNNTYAIRSKAEDNAGNTETPGTGNTFLFDNLDPWSTASPPSSQIGGDIAIPYTAGDTGGSGLDHVRLWKNYESGGWAITSGYETGSSGTFYFTPTEGDGIYCFQSIAHDNAYNEENGPSGSGDGCTAYSGTAPNHDPTLDWTGESNYVSDGLHPESGGTGDSYVYRIEYTDVDGDPPSYVRVHIEKGGTGISGSPFTMAYVSGSYTTGAIYSYSKAGLAEGTDYTYYFVAQDDQGHDATPTTELNAPDVTTPNDPPTLDWTGEPNYVSDGLHPESGGTGDSYVYRIEYTDPDGDPPAYVQVIIEKGGTPISGNPFAMSYVSGSYTTGAIYSYTKTGFAAGTDYTYYFEAQDDQGSPATPTSELDAPDVTGTNDPPVLSWTGEANYVSDGLHPESGGTGDDYVYRVKYSDPDGDPPAYVQVIIEKGGSAISGNPFTLACASGDYTTGVICSYTKAGMAEGSDYTYHFEAEDDQGNPATPTSELDAPDVSDSGLPEWTFLVYLNGDNPAEGAAIDDFLEMSSIGSTGQVNIVAWFDRAGGYDDRYGDWTGSYKFYITEDMTPELTNGVPVGEKDMSDPQTLIDFVQTETANYPAEHYALIIWDRGSELRRDPPEDTLFGDICWDNYPYALMAMTMAELQTALSTITNDGAAPLDLLGFDASLMALTEIDSQLKPYSDVRVSSQATEPSGGWSYVEVLSWLTTIPEMTPAEFAYQIVDWYCPNYGNEPTMSATDLQTPYSDLNTTVDDLVAALMSGAATHHADIATARANTQEFPNPHYVDLYDFASQLNTYVSDAAINAAATQVMNAVDGAVIDECGSLTWPDAHGISIYFPETQVEYDDTYDGDQGWLHYTADHQWDEWLHVFYTMGSIAPFPFYDGFESGTLGLGWSTFVTDTGRARVSSPSFRYEGSYTLSLDNEFEHANPSIAAAILTIDLSGQSEVYLDFWWRDWYDEAQPQDGVSFSDDWGLTWHQVYPFDLDPVSWYAHPIIDIAAEAASHGLTLNDHFQIKFQSFASEPISSSGDSDGYTIDAVWVDSSPHGVATLPFYDSFESGLQLHDVWQEYQPNCGNVLVVLPEYPHGNCYPHEGEYSVLLQGSDYSCSGNHTAAAILTVDLSHEAGALLDFWWKEWNDENHPEDGVFISDDQGATWYRVFSFNDGPSTYRHDIVDIAAHAQAHGLALSDIFQIRFQFYDESAYPNDGYSIDEVRLRPLKTTGFVPIVLKSF